ncbi:hypothetical protein AcW2_000375 [Taiwanofungus camphoratus]|nr:hypothetical protein AcW2_000375 [Antrodia cinnamomea]
MCTCARFNLSSFFQTHSASKLIALISIQNSMEKRWIYWTLFFLWSLSSASGSFSVLPVGNMLQQCLETTLIWTEEPPIHLWAASNNEDAPSDPTLHDFGFINSSYIFWAVDVPTGQNVSFTYVRTADPTLLLVSPEAYPVVAGPDTSCLLNNGTSSMPSVSTTYSPISSPISASNSVYSTTSSPNIPTFNSSSHSNLISSYTPTFMPGSRSTLITSSSSPFISSTQSLNSASLPNDSVSYRANFRGAAIVSIVGGTAIIVLAVRVF